MNRKRRKQRRKRRREQKRKKRRKRKNELRPTINQVYKKLRKIIESSISSEKVAKKVLEWGLEKITPENLKWAIENNVDLIQLSLNHYHLGHPLIKPLFKLVLQLHWDAIERYLTSAPLIYQLIVERKPECKPILDTPEGIDYLNRMIEHAYNTLYEIAWGEKP